MKRKRYRFCGMLLTASALLWATGCSSPIPFPELSSSSSAVTVPVDDWRIDLSALKSRIIAMKENWTQPGMEDEIAEGIQALFDTDNEAYAIHVRKEMAYNADWNNKELKRQSTLAYEDSHVVTEMVTWALANGYQNSAYQTLFEPYVDDSWIAYYLVNNLSRIENQARSGATQDSEFREQYYDTAYDSNADPDEADLTCAKLYLEALEKNDLSDCMYSVYNRDYTAEQSTAAFEAAQKYLLPVMDEIQMHLLLSPEYAAYQNGEAEKMDAYAVLKEYAPKLSQDIAESADKLFTDELYTAATGSGSFDGSYTVPLSGGQGALMYTHLDGDAFDLTTVVHEFGHFHCDWRDDTPIFLQANATDIAEVQSQGMEVLFTAFYDEIYGDSASFQELIEIYNLLYSAITGLAVGQFECDVMQHIDSYSAKDVLTLYNSYNEDYQIGLSLREITHLYEQPGYYVSYGVSALTALQIYAQMQQNPEQAKSMYDQISRISSISGEYGICKAAEKCGFADVFAEETVSSLADTLTARADILTGA